VTLAPKRPAAPARAAEQFVGGEVQLKARISEKLHRQVKVRIAERGISLQAYVVELLEADLAKRGGVG